MALITWQESFSVGDEEMDRQHKRLIDILNKLHDAMLRDEGTAVMGRLLAEMIAYTKVHFASEEKLLARLGFPDAAEHAEKHKALAAKVSSFASQYTDGKAPMTMQVLTFLRNWLQQHILVSDMDYREYNRQRSAEAPAEAENVAALPEAG